MGEAVYNIFLHYEQDVCSTVGYAIHEVELNDQMAFAFLQDRVETDFAEAKTLELRKSFTLDEYNAHARLGRAHHLIDELFALLNASPAPLFVVTPIVNGKPFFNHRSNNNAPLDMKAIAQSLGEKGEMPDWLLRYTTDAGIDIPQLIHDDYFLAIKVTYNAGLHVSAMKLLLSCVDSVAYIEYGDDRKTTPFINWLSTYADLTPLGITAPELWELRNGLLHMTNVSSSRVRTNRVRRISFRVSGKQMASQSGDGGIFYFEFYKLIVAFADAQSRWIASYNSDRTKFAKFVERYDETVSDSRMSVTRVG